METPKDKQRISNIEGLLKGYLKSVKQIHEHT
jgi:hypothetical protein